MSTKTESAFILGNKHQCDWRLEHGDFNCPCEKALAEWYSGPIHRGAPAPAVKYVTHGTKAYKA